MSWRTVVISSRCKLDLKMGYMVVRGDEMRRIYLDEIALLLIENPAVSMTGYLLSALMERKVKVIFCDSKHNPPVRAAALLRLPRYFKENLPPDLVDGGCLRSRMGRDSFGEDTQSGQASSRGRKTQGSPYA